MIYSKRDAIKQFRKTLQERSADSSYSNQDLYNALLMQAPWLIKREISAGRIYRNTYLFRTLPARDVIEVPTVPSCIRINTHCKIYRTKHPLPEAWVDNNGPVIKEVNSLDNSTRFTLISSSQWQDKINDPYQQYSTEKYVFYADGYLWFPKENPHKVNIRAYWKDDIRLVKEECEGCTSEKNCVKFLDTDFMVPDWVLAELFGKAAQALMPSKQMQEDEQIDKNPTRKN
jgi:hypothetical protein